jgi:hypothetical protein
MERIACVLLTVLTYAWALPAAAQTGASGSVRGVATDPQGARVPGVVVSATSPTVPGVYSATTDLLGQYRLGDLPPGDYTILGELLGFARFVRTPVTIRAGLNVEVNVPLTIGALDETVDVKLDTPLLETQSTVRSVNVSGELFRALPLMERRDWTGALMLAPGVTTSDVSGNERLFNVYGAEQAANIVQIDGADVSPSARTTSTSHVKLSGDAIDDVQIKTTGVDAASPLGLGGIINIATASGTNTLKGAVGLFLQPRSWNDSNQPGGTSSVTDQQQVDLSLGGPIVRDRMWAFGSYRYADITTGESRTSSNLEALRALIPDYVPADSTNLAHLGLAKLTVQPSSAHQLTAFYQRDINPLHEANATTEHTTVEKNGGHAASVRWNAAWSNRLTTRMGIAYNDKHRDLESGGVPGPVDRVYASTVLSAGRPVGNGALVNRGAPAAVLSHQPNHKTTISFDATWLTGGRLGTHEFQTGLFAQPKVQGTQQIYVNDGFNIQESVLRRAGDLGGGTVPFHRVIMNGPALATANQRTVDYAAYVQDAWRPTARLTVNAGVRVDRITIYDELYGITTQRSTDVGPRFGVNYAITGDGRNVARAHWVLVHDQPGTLTMTGTPTIGQRDLYDLDLDGTFETVFDTPATVGRTTNRSVDPSLHQPYVVDFGLGYRKQLPGNVAIGVDFVRRRFADRTTLVETNGKYNGNVFEGYIDESFNEFYTATNNRWSAPIYRSLDLSFTKRTARLQGIASYVRQWRHLNGTWQPNDPASFIQPAAFPSDRGIGSTAGIASAPVDANSLSGSHMASATTASGQWQDHTVRLGATCNVGWALHVAASYTYQSGSWSGPIVSRIAAPDPAFGPPTVRLSNGRLVTNPLATTIRFAYPTRGEGQLKTPPLHVANIRLSRTFVLPVVNLDAGLDVFNVTNNGTDHAFNSGGNQTYNPLYGTTRFRQLPRSAQIVLRTTF